MRIISASPFPETLGVRCTKQGLGLVAEFLASPGLIYVGSGCTKLGSTDMGLLWKQLLDMHWLSDCSRPGLVPGSI